VHVLANRPLTVPNGKKIVAKELMVFTGAHDYYHDESYDCDAIGNKHLNRRRYLTFDGHAISMNSKDVNHQPHYLRAVLGLLVAVAAFTRRILILPAIFHDS